MKTPAVGRGPAAEFYDFLWSNHADSIDRQSSDCNKKFTRDWPRWVCGDATATISCGFPAEHQCQIVCSAVAICIVHSPVSMRSASLRLDLTGHNETYVRSCYSLVV